jgi:4-amino-4-deoxy-L-arabinose transferase-like glycosyltransferase
VGLVAALLYILDPAVMLLSFQYMSETLFMFLFMLFLFILLSRPIQPAIPRSLFYAGILLGVVTLVRPITQFLPPFVLAFIFFLHKGSWKASRLYLSLGAFSLGMILIVTPWMARNRLHAGEFQISVIGPYNLTYYVSLYLAAKYGVPFEVVRAQYQSNITRARSVGDPSSTVEFTRQNMEYVSRGIGGDIAGYLRFHLVNTLPFLTASSWKVPVIYYRSHVRENPLPPPSLAGYPNVLLGARLGPVIAILLQRPPEWFYGLERLARVLLFAFAALPLWFEGRDRRIVCLFLFGLILYFAFLTGPVSHARYRLPGEPSLFLLGLWGIEFVRRRWRGQAGLGTPPSCLS